MGAFADSLKRNNRKIRDDRAQAITEDTELLYKRTIEDLELSLKKMNRDRDNMLDLSPTDANSLTLASDFKCGVFVDKDMELGLKIRKSRTYSGGYCRMGTRHLIVVQSKGEYRVAQYGQWDGYPSGQGVAILKFLRRVNLPIFQNNVESCSFFMDDELEALGKTWLETNPQLSREQGSTILDLVNVEGGIKLRDSLGFAGDSLFCEWAYVIDLDIGRLEVYVGFNKDKITEGRFISGDPDLDYNDYEPVKLVKSYDLYSLPTDEVFEEDLDEED